MNPRRTAALVAAAALLATGSFALGRATGDDVTWRSGTAVLGGDETSPQFSSVSEDERWTYGASGVVDRWIDAQGESHADSWPTCLLPPTEANPQRPQTVPVRFATVPVDDGVSAGPRVVLVDCRV